MLHVDWVSSYLFRPKWKLRAWRWIESSRGCSLEFPAKARGLVCVRALSSVLLGLLVPPLPRPLLSEDAYVCVCVRVGCMSGKASDTAEGEVSNRPNIVCKCMCVFVYVCTCKCDVYH